MKKELSTKEKVLMYLESKNKNFVSGEEMASEMFLTRASVWKAIKSLREEGYKIEAVSNRGYRLMLEKDVLLPNVIESLLVDTGRPIDVYVYEEIDSTNDEAKRLIGMDGREKLVVSDFQSKGRGRRGREFFSPKGSGLYLSLALKPDMSLEKATRVTCMAAVALVRAIKQVLNIEAKIKWVNDIYYKERKVAGILTEGFTSFEDNSLDCVVIGVGINLYEPDGGFPDEIRKTAGVLCAEGQTETDLRNRLCGEFVKELFLIMNGSNDYISEYRSASCLKGSFVKVMDGGTRKAMGYSKVLDVDEECRLVVENEDGSVTALSSGEVSVVKY